MLYLVEYFIVLFVDFNVDKLWVILVVINVLKKRNFFYEELNVIIYGYKYNIQGVVQYYVYNNNISFIFMIQLIVYLINFNRYEFNFVISLENFFLLIYKIKFYYM